MTHGLLSFCSRRVYRALQLCYNLCLHADRLWLNANEKIHGPLLSSNGGNAPYSNDGDIWEAAVVEKMVESLKMWPSFLEKKFDWQLHEKPSFKQFCSLGFFLRKRPVFWMSGLATFKAKNPDNLVFWLIWKSTKRRKSLIQIQNRKAQHFFENCFFWVSAKVSPCAWFEVETWQGEVDPSRGR